MKELTKKIARFSKTPSGAFIFLSSFFGLLFIFIIPPLQTPDEASHFLRSYQVSELRFVSQQQNGTTGDFLPKSLGGTFVILNGKQPIQFYPELKYQPGITKAAIKVPLNQGDKKFYDITAPSSYPPIGYAPQAIAIGLGRLFDAPPILLLYLARLGVLIAWIVIMAAAIKIIPYRKWTLVGLAILPMMVAQSMSIGVDAMSIGAGVLFLALILRGISAQKVSQQTAWLIIVTAIVMVMSKQIALLLLPLIFLVSNKAFWSKRAAVLLKVAVVVLPFVMLFGWIALTSEFTASPTQIANNQSPSGQIKFLLNNPLHAFVVTFNTFMFGWGDSVFQSVIGVFGWMDTPLSGGFITLGYLTLAVLLLLSYREKVMTQLTAKKLRYYMVALGVVYFFAVCGALYVTYTPVGFNTIIGIQGRYLLPILFLFVPAFYGLAFVSKRRYIIMTLSLLAILLLASIVTIIFRFYIEYKY